MHWFLEADLLLIVCLPLLSALSRIRRPGVGHSAIPATLAMSASFMLSLIAFGCSVAQSRTSDSLLQLDRLSAVMLVLVTGISTVVHAFAVRYMDSDSRYGRFVGWLSAVTGFVVIVVLANNLILLAAGWIAVSLGLYQLQTQYRERPAAMAAAALMRSTHAVGDVAMLAACIVLGIASGGAVIDAALARAGALSPAAVSTVVALFAIAAFSKSAQIPLHRWLPQTMEAPTPVSALMHAGIVNAGGFLLARFSLLVVHAQVVATGIFVVGAITALWAASCMLVRSDVKRGLAYSTVSQMGYMIMQCGLGAFPTAIVHLFAHGIFKATLFLGSGYAIADHKRELRAPASAARGIRRRWAGATAAALVVPFAILVASSSLGRALPAYGWVLLAFATLTCMQTAFAIVTRGTVAEWYCAAVLVLAALPAYVTAVGWFDRFLAADVAATTLLVPTPLVVASVAVFASVLILGWGLIRIPASWRDRAYVWLLSERLPLGFAR